MIATETKKAPVLSGNSADEGENQNPTNKKESDMSTTVSALADIPAEARATMAFKSGPYTADELAFASSEKLERLEKRYVLSSEPRPAMFQDPEGNTFRKAGDLDLRTREDGTREIVAYIFEDSMSHDFLILGRIINDARFGRMDGWRRCPATDDRAEVWIFDYPNYNIDGFTLEPAAIIDETTWGYPCTEPRCRENLHEHNDGSHTLDVLENHLTKNGSYEIEICKDMTKPDSAWYVNLWANGDLTELTPEQIATLANDLQWMGLECATTNAKGSAA